MTTPTNHTVTIHTRFANTITAPVVLVERLGDGRATVHIETNYHVESGLDLTATSVAVAVG